MRRAPIASCGARCPPVSSRPRRRRRPTSTTSSIPTPSCRRRTCFYFLEKNSPGLKPWQRETLRIVRNLAQYFYPQRQLKVMNEGCATFVHYTIMNRLYDKGMIDEGRAAGVHAQPHQRRVPAGLRRQALLRDQSLCARLCDDGRHPPHLRAAFGRGPGVVPGAGGAQATALPRCATPGRTIATKASSSSSCRRS